MRYMITLAAILLLAGCAEPDFNGVDIRRIGEPWRSVVSGAVDEFNTTGDEMYHVDKDGDIIVLFGTVPQGSAVLVTCWDYWCRIRLDPWKACSPEELRKSMMWALSSLEGLVNRVE